MKQRYFCLLAFAIISLLACNTSGTTTNSTAADTSLNSGKVCMDSILSADSQLGSIRNHACEKISLSPTIQQYVEGLAALDFSNCPKAFTEAFQRHQAAWLDMMLVTDKYPDLRGEMHDLFDQIKTGDNAHEFEPRLKAIWDTWEEVEAATKEK